MMDIIGCFLAVGLPVIAISCFICYGVGWDRGWNEGSNTQCSMSQRIKEDMRAEHATHIKSLAERHARDLWDLRERCAAYAEARIDADQSAGFIESDGPTIGALIQCVPLRREDAPQTGKDS